MKDVSRLDFSVIGNGIEYSPSVSLCTKIEQIIFHILDDIGSILEKENLISDMAYSSVDHYLLSIIEPNDTVSFDKGVEIKKAIEKYYEIGEFYFSGVHDKDLNKEPFLHISILI